MDYYRNKLYLEDVAATAHLDLPWEKLAGKSMLLTGATGLIGSFLVDVLMEKNRTDGLDCTIYALSRSEERAKIRFSWYASDEKLVTLAHDVNAPLLREDLDRVDYVLHLASNTHPLQYATDPIGTITANLIGAQNMMEFAATHHASRFLFSSSNEVYGENRGDVELFDETYCGYINCNTMRAGYPESKRCAEALCQAYKAQKGLDVVIARLTRSYGPTMLTSDTKAISQFIKRGVAGEDIILKSEGYQYYSYTYMADAVGGLLTVLLRGANGEAYNIAREDSDITLRDLASIIAEAAGSKVVFELPDAVEASGYSTATKARLSGAKLQALGWEPRYDIRRGILRTLEVLKELNK